MWAAFAGQRDTVADVGPGVEMAKRERRASARGGHCAELPFEGVGQFEAEGVRVERAQLGGVLGGRRPHDRRGAVRERQEGERTGGQEALPCSLAVRHRGAHLGHHRLLAVVAFVDVDSRELAHLRARTVGADDERRAQAPPAEHDLRLAVVEGESGERLPPVPVDVRLRLDPLLDRPLHDCVLDDVAEARLADFGAVEMHLRGAFPYVHLAHRPDPLRGQHRPYPQCAQDALGRHRERADPRSPGRPGRRGRCARSFDHRDAQAHLPQGKGQRRSDEPTPGDDDVVPHARSPRASRGTRPASPIARRASVAATSPPPATMTSYLTGGAPGRASARARPAPSHGGPAHASTRARGPGQRAPGRAAARAERHGDRRGRRARR